MNDLEFGKPGHTYKKVKAIKLSLSNKAGADVPTSVFVYLYAGGTPHFAVRIPQEWSDFFAAHHSGHQHKLALDNGVLSSTDFDGIEKGLTTISRLYATFVKERSLKKVIVYCVTLKAPSVQLNALSFSDQYSHIVGLSASVRYLVNDQLYAVTGLTSEKMAALQEAPLWDDLHSSGSGRGLSVPFTIEAWETFRAIKHTLERAADALQRLKDPSQAELLLAAGAQALLSSTEVA